MRLATWNCASGPLDQKLALGLSIAADVLVVPELPRLPADSEHGVWVGRNPNKGLAVISSPGFTLHQIDLGEALPDYVVPLRVTGLASFVLLAVWSQNGGPDKYVRGVLRAVSQCEALISSSPTVMLGDFNSNSIWDSEYPRTLNHSALVSRLDALGMVSAYHAYHDEEHGAETRPTFFLYRHENRPYHIDFAFLPKTWRDHIRNVDLGTFSDWSGHSDHVPLTVDLEHSEI